MQDNFTDTRLVYYSNPNFEEWEQSTEPRLDNISLLFLNIRSMGKNWDTLLTQLYSANKVFDIIMLAEIWCDEKDLSIYDLPNYNKIYKLRENKKGGGLLLFYNSKKLKFNEIEMQDIVSYEHITGNFETDLKTAHNNFTLHLIYRPPSSCSGFPIQRAVQELDRSLCILENNKNLIVVGDTNINSNNYDDGNVQSYEAVMSGWGLERGILGITREEVRANALTSSCIDHIYYRLDDNIITKIFTGIINTKISDHYPICCELVMKDSSLGLNGSGRDNTRPIFYNHLFVTKLKAVKWNLEEYGNVDEGFLKLTSRFSDLYQSCTNIGKNNRPRGILLKPLVKRKKWMTNEIVRLIKERDRIFKLWKNDPSNNGNRILYKRLRNRIISKIRQQKEAHYRDFFARNKRDSKKVWGCVNDIIGRSKKNSIDDTVITAMGRDKSTTEIVNGFANYFIEGVEGIKHTCSRLNVNQSRANIDRARFDVRNDTLGPNYRFYIPKIAPQILIKHIDEMNENKSAGYDKIRAKDIKLVKNEISEPLSRLINSSFHQGVFPNCLKKAVIRPIFKSKSKKEYSNYRPIAILPAIEKILEKHVSIYLNKYLTENQIISEKQYGFTKDRGTGDALLGFATVANEVMESKCHGLALFVDLSKAFDTIEHGQLISALFNIGIRGQQLKWFHSYLYNRKFVVKIKDEYSNEKTISCGVPQGSRLGPTLFIIYLNEILNKIDDCYVWAFADDILLFSVHKNLKTAERRLQRAFQMFNDWTHDKGLVINSQKTFLLHIKPKNLRSQDEIKIKYHRCDCTNKLNETNCTCESLQIVDKTKYLGVVVDNKLLWNHHITHLHKRLNSLVPMMYNLRNKVSDKVKLMVYKALYESIIRYGITTWGTAAESHLKTLNNLQRRCLKALQLNGLEPVYREHLFLGQTNIMGHLTPKGLYFHAILMIYHKNNEYKSLRNNRENLRYTQRYEVPLPRTSYGYRMPNYIVPYLLNKTPFEIDSIDNDSMYKKSLYIWISQQNEPI